MGRIDKEEVEQMGEQQRPVLSHARKQVLPIESPLLPCYDMHYICSVIAVALLYKSLEAYSILGRGYEDLLSENNCRAAPIYPEAVDFGDTIARAMYYIDTATVEDRFREPDRVLRTGVEACPRQSSQSTGHVFLLDKKI